MSSQSRVFRVPLLAVLILIIIIFTSTFYVLTRKLGLDSRALALDKEEYRVGEKATLIIRNIWKSTILIGAEYSLSRNLDGSWVEIPVLGLNEAWTAAILLLRPGESYRQVIDLDGFQTGEYRLRKEFHFTEPEETRAYFVRFIITG